jgi:hypothetical protein
MLDLKRPLVLSGKRILVAVGNPPHEEVNFPAIRQIEEAAIRTAVGVYNANGTLVFSSRASLTPAMGYPCADYQSFNSGPVCEIWQTNAISSPQARDAPSKELQNARGVKIVWAPAIGGEKFVESEDTEQNRKNCQASLQFMREQMVNTPLDALVLIGGFEGSVVEEYNLFRKAHPTKPIYAMTTTGGEAKQIADSNAGVVSFDDEIVKNLEEFYRKTGRSRTTSFIPYTSVVSRIIESIK